MAVSYCSCLDMSSFFVLEFSTSPWCAIVCHGLLDHISDVSQVELGILESCIRQNLRTEDR